VDESLFAAQPPRSNKMNTTPKLRPAKSRPPAALAFRTPISIDFMANLGWIVGGPPILASRFFADYR
jgi:hypothetical protein